MKYGTPSPVPFRVVDERAGIDIDIGISCFGQYSFRLANPLLFYTKVAGNVSDVFDIKGSELEGQMRSELLTALQPAFGRLSAMGVRYSAIPGHAKELSDAMKYELSDPWGQERGIEIAKIGVNSVKASDEDEKMIKDLQRNAAFMDPTRAAAHMIGAQASAMQTAAGNTAGAMTGFMGMGMAQGMGGVNAANLFQMGQQQQTQQPAPASPAGWICTCGQNGNTGKFCANCGQPKPSPKPAAGSWKCSCGVTATGKFCPECGKPRPVVSDDGWTCTCGTVNKGKFCAECGTKKPAGIPQYKCDKCGWEPEKGVKPPKFCPECGDPFDDGDLIQ